MTIYTFWERKPVDSKGDEGLVYFLRFEGRSITECQSDNLLSLSERFCENFNEDMDFVTTIDATQIRAGFIESKVSDEKLIDVVNYLRQFSRQEAIKRKR